MAKPFKLEQFAVRKGASAGTLVGPFNLIARRPHSPVAFMSTRKEFSGYILARFTVVHQPRINVKLHRASRVASSSGSCAFCSNQHDAPPDKPVVSSAHLRMFN